MEKYNNKTFKQELGLQFSLIRRYLRKPIELVAEETHLHPTLIDYIEMGERISWKKYFQLLDYYHCRVKIVFPEVLKKESCEQV